MGNNPEPAKVVDFAAPASDSLGRVPTAFDDAVVWAAWLYYADQLNQSDVAKALGVSRATVVNLLQEARERGVVTISLRSDLAARTGAAGRLIQRYGLAEALVIPSRGEVSLADRLGDAAARLLADKLTAGDVIGIAWGRTVLAAARAMTPHEPVPRLTVVQVAGSSTASDTFSPELCTSLMAGRLDARCVNLLAPALLSSAELRDRLMAEPMLVNHAASIRRGRSRPQQHGAEIGLRQCGGDRPVCASRGHRRGDRPFYRPERRARQGRARSAHDRHNARRDASRADEDLRVGRPGQTGSDPRGAGGRPGHPLGDRRRKRATLARIAGTANTGRY